MIDSQELVRAYHEVRRELLAQRTREGYWVGELSSSALSTATAVSALTLVARNSADPSRQAVCRQLAGKGLGWLARCQNDDGGWGDTDRSFSNIAATLLVRAAFELAGATQDHAPMLARALRYTDAQGGVSGLRRRYGKDKTFAVPILTNCALAGMVPWSEVDPLPFEVACVPYVLLRFLRLPVVSYAVPALVAIGQARYFHSKPLNPLRRLVRRLATRPSLNVLAQMQPTSGGYLEAIPLTSFVVMSLASIGRVEHAVVRRGVNFLLNSMRLDGSWPIDTNLATWNTTLAIQALATASGDVGALGCLSWLLSCQHRQVHPFTHAAAGGWGWSNLSGAVPDVDDTSGALLALRLLETSTPEADQARIDAAVAGVRWLLGIQNADGGWPTFCRGWGTLPFDRSGADLTAHAIRALHAWREVAQPGTVDAAIERGLAYLEQKQHCDGYWTPLWFGSQFRSDEANPVYGTGRVLLAYRDLRKLDCQAARRGMAWLVGSQGPDGGWGGSAEHPQPAGKTASVEETSIAVKALLAASNDPLVGPAVEAGLRWLAGAIARGRHREAAPIGFYFAKLWYYERVYPLVFAVAALGSAVRQDFPQANSWEK
jgi:squalene-hopene/tetraprenyl-beta-curcumene cyclase